jgi:glycosyltransferase involved in cell wall biosynthesis
MNILMSYNKNEGYGALGRYVELANNLLKLDDIKIFFISPKGYNRSSGGNFFHFGYKKKNIKPNFIYGWLMITLIIIKNFSKIKNIDKCVLFNGSNSFIFAFLKFFFKYELIYSVRVNIFKNGNIDTSLYNLNIGKLYFKKIQYKFYSLLENYIVNKSEKVVFQSQINADEYKKMYGIESHKIFILKNNCNPMWIGNKRKLNLKKGFNIGFVGNLFFNKGVKVIIDAFKLVNDKKPNCFLTIIGDGPDTEFFKSHVDKLMINNISFLGHKKNAFELMHNFDLLVVPSYMEAFPNVVLEALYYNIPVLGSEVGGIALILDQEFLFKVGDHKILSNKIIKMLDTDNYNVALKTIKKLRNKFLFDWGYEFYKIIKA